MCVCPLAWLAREQKYFTWDAHNFPHPADMQTHISSHGREMVTIVDPHMKRDSGYSVHTTALEKGLYVKTASDGVYEGWCWPGSVSYLDFLDPAVRQFWADQFALDKYTGSTPHLFTWNDMNEPSVFNGPEVTMPKDCRHLQSSVEHRDVHNVYGHYNHMSTAQGLRQRDNKRPFVLTRSFFAGSQRYSAVWTGDNAADWSHLAIATPMLLSLNVAGITFSGADVGGFFKDPDAELLTRWYQAAAYQPFFRGHAHIETKRREPWLFGDPYTAHIKAAIKARYTLLPYIYTLFYHAATTGVPVMRPLWAEFPQDESTFAMDSEFLLGPALLIAPVSSAGAQSVSVYLPTGTWFDYHTLQPVQSGQHTVPVTLSSIPVYYRGGSVVVRKDRARRSSRLMKHDPFTIVVAADSNLNAAGRLYLDDGDSFEYQHGQFAYRELELLDGKELRATRVKGSSGVLKSDVAVERIVVLGLPRATTATVTLSGGDTRRLEASRAKDGSFVIRKPELPVTDNWSITLQ